VYTIAVVAEKGGVGKTTVALNLAVAAVQHGRSVAVVDLDPQATASKWTDRRTADQPWVVPTHAARLDAALAQAQAQGVELVVIDTPPHAGADAVEAARRADLVLVPVEPHVFTLETVPKLADLLKLAGKTPAIFVVTKAATQGREGTDAAAHLEAQGCTVCSVILYLRAAHRHATNVGQVAAEFAPDSKAADEVRRLYTDTMRRLTVSRTRHAKTKPPHART
jgi:chromosome partitioning protein